MPQIRRIIGDVLIGSVIIYMLYLAAITSQRIGAVVLKDTYAEIFRYELFLCAIVLILALDVRFGLFAWAKRGPLRFAGLALRVVVIALSAAILCFWGKIAVGGLFHATGTADHAIVLGLALENGQPTDDLRRRLNTARAFLDANPEATLILTGGNPDASGRTEAAVMRELLTADGVPAEKLILEDQAETTKANFRNTAKLIDPTAPVVLITSDYHMDRAIQTAKDAGFTHVLRMPAPSSPVQYGANVMSEVVLEINELTLRRE